MAVKFLGDGAEGVISGNGVVGQSRHGGIRGGLPGQEKERPRVDVVRAEVGVGEKDRAVRDDGEAGVHTSD